MLQAQMRPHWKDKKTLYNKLKFEFLTLFLDLLQYALVHIFLNFLLRIYGAVYCYFAKRVLLMR